MMITTIVVHGMAVVTATITGSAQPIVGETCGRYSELAGLPSFLDRLIEIRRRADLDGTVEHTPLRPGPNDIGFRICQKCAGPPCLPLEARLLAAEAGIREALDREWYSEEWLRR